MKKSLKRKKKAAADSHFIEIRFFLVGLKEDEGVLPRKDSGK